MRRHPLHTRPSVLLTGLVALVLALSVTGCSAARSPSTARVSSPAPAATSRPLRQVYVYTDNTLAVDGVANGTQTKPGGTLSVTWTARKYMMSAEVAPIMLSVFVYGPFASNAAAQQAMRLGGPPSPGNLAPTPVPLSQLALSPFASAQPVHADTLTTTPFTMTLRLPASIPAGYYDIAMVSVAGAQTVMRGDAPLRVTSA